MRQYGSRKQILVIQILISSTTPALQPCRAVRPASCASNLDYIKQIQKRINVLRAIKIQYRISQLRSVSSSELVKTREPGESFGQVITVATASPGAPLKPAP